MADTLVETVDGRVQIRTDYGHVFRLVRVEDGKELQRIGALAAARARARDLIEKGHA
jgi:hypothetical protein